MRFLINKRLHVNMDNYEHVEITGSVEVDTIADEESLVDLDIDPHKPEAVMGFIREQLDALLAPGVADAATYTDREDSFVLPYHQDRSTERKRK